jgi:predicted house-cleaning noncanonical NTP pyrophosphatase (MazG superfamily)
MKKYDKLVRDKIPEVIRENGKQCKTRKMKPEEVEAYFRSKVQEELDELFEDPNPEEMADLMEVVDCLRKMLSLSIEEVIDAKYNKRAERGSFEKGIILLEVSD